MLTLICQNLNCSKEFKSYRENAKFCSIECRDEGKVKVEMEGELFVRYCPVCGIKLYNKSRYNCWNSIKKKKGCAKCAQDTEKSRNFQKSRKGKPVDKTPYQTKEFLDKMSRLSSGKNNPMYGKTVYSI